MQFNAQVHCATRSIRVISPMQDTLRTGATWSVVQAAARNVRCIVIIALLP